MLGTVDLKALLTLTHLTLLRIYFLQFEKEKEIMYLNAF